MARRGKEQGGTIVLKRIEAGGHGHHGGAWKVAYADFVTAMMAFFLLMWLLNATTEEQRRGIADFFNPSSALSAGQSGVALPFGGRTPHSQGQMAADTGAIRLERGPRPTQSEAEEEEVEPPVASQPNPAAPPGEEDAPAPRRVAEGGRMERGEAQAGEGASGDQAGGEAQDAPPAQLPPLPLGAAQAAERARQIEAAEREQQRLEEAADALRAAFLGDPQLAELARQVLVEIVPEGLRIQLLESDGTPMFATGGTQPTERVRLMIREVARSTAALPNPLTITGHTDSAPFRGSARSNWDLSAERANAARRLLVESGIAEARLRGVTGMADREPLLPGQPQAAANRRVAITLLREAPLPR